MAKRAAGGRGAFDLDRAALDGAARLGAVGHRFDADSVAPLLFIVGWSPAHGTPPRDKKALRDRALAALSGDRGAVLPPCVTRHGLHALRVWIEAHPEREVREIIAYARGCHDCAGVFVEQARRAAAEAEARAAAPPPAAIPDGGLMRIDWAAMRNQAGD